MGRYEVKTRARHEPSQRSEKIHFTVPAHLRKVGAPRYSKIAYYRRLQNAPIFTPNDPEYLAQCIEDTQSHIDQLRLLSDMYFQQQRLDRLTLRQPDSPSFDPPSDIPLINRISAPIPEAPPSSLHFRKSKIISREQEYWKMIRSLNNRIIGVRDKIKIDGPADRYSDNVERFFRNYDDFRAVFHVASNSYTNKTWRNLKRDLKAVESIPLGDMHDEKRWDQICMEFAALGKENRFVF